MNTRFLGLKTSLVVALATAVFLPQMSPASTLSDKQEIQQLKSQLNHCLMHKKAKKKRHISFRKRSRSIAAVETRVIERPVFVDRVVEKQVFLDRPVMVEKQMVEKQMDSMAIMESTPGERVLVQHTKKKRKPFIHVGIPFIGVDLF